MTEPPTSHRRDFVRAIALGGTALATGAPAIAQDPEKPGEEPPKAASEADARMDLILARHGSYLDDDARKAVRDEVEALVRRGEQLRKFELTNGDEPMPVFAPYRSPLA